jgi:hypothetical protein
VPLSLQKLRELADSLRASMPVDDLLDDKAGTSSPLQKKGLGARSKGTAKNRRKLLAVDDKPSQLKEMDIENLQLGVGQLEAKYDSLNTEHNAMLIEAKKQQQDFIRREVQYKSQIKRMTELLTTAENSRSLSRPLLIPHTIMSEILQMNP